MTPRSVVLLVEGDGDRSAAPILVKKLLTQQGAWDAVRLDKDPPIKVGEFAKAIKQASTGQRLTTWQRLVAVAAKRKNVGGCLLILDGDSKRKLDGATFCASRAARLLAEQARVVGGGSLFSVAVVFACMEFESWLIAGASSLAGKMFSDGRKELPEVLHPPKSDLEVAPRDAKGWFRQQLWSGYKPARDQQVLAQLVDMDVIRERKLRSFQRLENATQQLVAAIRSGCHIVSPDPTAND